MRLKKTSEKAQSDRLFITKGIKRKNMSYDILKDFNDIPGVQETVNQEVPDTAPNIFFLPLCDTKQKQIDYLKNTKLFRIFKVEHFLNWVTTGKNTLVSVEKWDDPWERGIFKQRNIICNGVPLDLSNFLYYGQCWSTDERETDAIWRIFNAKGGDCVRVEVNAFDLWSSFKKYVDNMSGSCSLSSVLCSCGLVKYLNEPGVKKFFESDSIEGRLSTNSFVETLYAKREGFSHEKEFRIIYYETNVSSIPGANVAALTPCGDLFSFDMDPGLIKSVLFGPKLSSNYNDYINQKHAFDQFKSQIQCVGIPKIERSTLYDFPALNISFT